MRPLLQGAPMADGSVYRQFRQDAQPVDLDTAISLIETGCADEALVVDLGDGVLARADGRLGLAGLLQRLRGHRTLCVLSRQSGAAAPTALRSGMPDVHPQVAEILDALRK